MLYAVGMTNETTTIEWVEGKDLTVGDMTDLGFITHLISYWDGVTITAEGINLKTGNTYESRWTVAPTHFVRITR
jgi:hypothetical protein